MNPKKGLLLSLPFLLNQEMHSAAVFSLIN